MSKPNRGIELTVDQRPVFVRFTCPICDEETVIDYPEFIDMMGDPPDWTGSHIKCEHCGEKLRIDSQEWD